MLYELNLKNAAASRPIPIQLTCSVSMIVAEVTKSQLKLFAHHLVRVGVRSAIQYGISSGLSYPWTVTPKFLVHLRDLAKTGCNRRIRGFMTWSFLKSYK